MTENYPAQTIAPDSPLAPDDRESVEVLIVGAGPAGLATAIAAVRLGLTYRVLEKGVLVNSIFQFPRNMVFFTTPDLLEIGGLPFTSPNEKPSRTEALRYYRRVTDAFRLRIQFDERVRSIAPQSGNESRDHAFEIEAVTSQGQKRSYRAKTAVLATGYYDNPNLLEIPGENLPRVSHYYTEAHGFFRKAVVVVGGNNSAAEAALDLYRTGAQVTLVHRGSELGKSIKYWVRPDITNRINEGAIHALLGTRVLEILPKTVKVTSNGSPMEISADAVFLMTGYHPDIRLLSGAGVRIDPETLVPDHNPETFETNVPGLYLAGAAAGGKNTNLIFIENGRFHGEVAAREIARRLGKLPDIRQSTSSKRHLLDE